MKLSNIIDDNTTTGKVINLIGKICTPTGVVAIFCSLMSLSNLETAIVSLITMILTLIILFYHPINKKVPSSVILILLLILSTVFFFGYQNILTKDTGLIKYWKPSSKIIGIIPEKIKRSKQEIWFYGTNFHITAEDDRKLLLDKLSEGVRIRYLVFNPYSPILSIAAKDFDQPETKLKQECLEGLGSIINLESKWNDLKKECKTPGELEVRLYNELPRLRAYIFDPANERSECFYVPYLHKTNSPELPAFQFKNQKGGVFEDYFSSINKLWQSSIKLETFRNDNKGIDSLYDGK